MGSWGLPVAAGAFWAGLVLWDARPAWLVGVPAWCWLAIGLALLVGAWLVAPGARRGDPVAEAGLAPDPPSVVAAVTRGGVDGRRGPLAAVGLLVVGVTIVGLGWGGVAEMRREGSLLGRLAPRSVEVVGTLREDASQGTYGWHALVDVTSVSWAEGAASLRETVWVDGDGDLPVAVRGDLVRVEGRLQIPDDEGFADALRRRGLSVALSSDTLERLGPAPNPFVHVTQVVRAFIGDSIWRIFPPREAGLLLGLVLGDDSRLDPATSRDFQATGLGHLLVVSGENVAMVLAPMLVLASFVRVARFGRFVLGLGTVLLFVVLTGAEPSVLRAGAMATLSLLGVLLGRPRATGVVLSGAVLVLLVLDPWLVHAIGFQLSVVATAGMVALATPIAGVLARALPKPVALAAATTIAAQFGVTPILLFHFHEVPGVTVLANLAAFPAVSPALLLGIAASALGLVWMPLGQLVALLARVPMRYLEIVANILAKAPVAWITSGGGPIVLLVGGAIVVAVALWARSGWRPPRRLVVVAISLTPLLAWSTALGVGPPGAVTVRFLDVGQGDATLITSPGGATVLIDGGPDEEVVAQQLVALGVKRLDLVIATHPHADHIAGLPQVLARFSVGLFEQPGCPDDTELQAEVQDELSVESIPIRPARAGDTITVGDLVLTVLSPDRCWIDSHSDPNNDSVIVLLQVGATSVLFAGDAEKEAQQTMLERGLVPDVDVLKVPHHGGATSLPEFFQAADPELAMISVGQPNPYGHPNAEALAWIGATGAQIWRTDEHGTVTITIGADGGAVLTSAK